MRIESHSADDNALHVWAAIIMRDPRLHFDLEFGMRFRNSGESSVTATAEWATDIASRLFVLVAVDEYYSSPGHHREPDILPQIYSVTRSDVATLRAYLRASVSDKGYILGAGTSEEFIALDPRCLPIANDLLTQEDADLGYITGVLAGLIQGMLFRAS